MAEMFFWMWFLFGQFNGYDFHNCDMGLSAPDGPTVVACFGGPHTHSDPKESIRQR